MTPFGGTKNIIDELPGGGSGSNLIRVVDSTAPGHADTIPVDIAGSAPTNQGFIDVHILV